MLPKLLSPFQFTGATLSSGRVVKNRRVKRVDGGSTRNVHELELSGYFVPTSFRYLCELFADVCCGTVEIKCDPVEGMESVGAALLFDVAPVSAASGDAVPVTSPEPSERPSEQIDPHSKDHNGDGERGGCTSDGAVAEGVGVASGKEGPKRPYGRRGGLDGGAVGGANVDSGCDIYERRTRAALDAAMVVPTPQVVLSVKKEAQFGNECLAGEETKARSGGGGEGDDGVSQPHTAFSLELYVVGAMTLG